jgi:formylglycine-generating enzyme required for sulfatase activity
MNARAALLASLLVLAACAGKVTDPPDALVDPYDNACPKGGGPMVEVPAPPGGAPFCIDATEVTNAAYAAWLATNPGLDLMPSECHAGPWLGRVVLDDYRPEEFGVENTLHWPVASDHDDYPVVWVTWCDAAAFCAGNGKRLCGRMGGEAISVGQNQLPELAPQISDPTASEFLYAGTRGGAQTFVYGDERDPGACWSFGVHPVGTKPTCEGGYAGIFDLDGNAAEYVNACNLTYEDSNFEGVDCVAEGVWLPAAASGVQFTVTSASVGFRCCADP